MTIHRNAMTALRATLTAVLLVGLGACGSDSVTDPTFGSACNATSCSTVPRFCLRHALIPVNARTHSPTLASASIHSGLMPHGIPQG